jgi:hypothetical protein
MEPAPVAEQPINNQIVRLPPFWPSNPAAWFANADGQFALRNITCERTKYFNALTALPEATVNLITDFVESELPADAYTQLRARLNAAHQLTDYQRVEQMVALPPLGDRKPSEMLAEMVRLCPRGQENSVFFVYFFLHRLPRELRVLLTDVDHQDRRALALRADDLWAHNVRGVHDSVAAAVNVEVQQEESSVAAVRTANGGRGQRGGRGRRGVSRGSSGQNRAAGNGSGGGQTAQLTPSDMARAGSDLCYYHWSFGAKASKCNAPCSWQGN